MTTHANSSGICQPLRRIRGAGQPANGLRTGLHEAPPAHDARRDAQRDRDGYDDGEEDEPCVNAVEKAREGAQMLRSGHGYVKARIMMGGIGGSFYAVFCDPRLFMLTLNGDCEGGHAAT